MGVLRHLDRQTAQKTLHPSGFLPKTTALGKLKMPGYPPPSQSRSVPTDREQEVIPFPLVMVLVLLKVSLELRAHF